jgi:hypothetical protein
MSVILDALERAKQEQARRKGSSRPAPASEFSQPGLPPLPASDTEDRGPRSVSQNSGLGPALYLIAVALLLLLATAVGLVTYLLLERNRPQGAPTTGSQAIQMPADPMASTPGSLPLATATGAIPSGLPIGPAQPQPVYQPVAELPVAHQPTIDSPGANDGLNPSTNNPIGLPAPALILPKLGSIICDERGCTAMIDGRSSREGDWSGEFQVLQITQEMVSLRDSAGRLHNLFVRR